VRRWKKSTQPPKIFIQQGKKIRLIFVSSFEGGRGQSATILYVSGGRGTKSSVAKIKHIFASREKGGGTRGAQFHWAATWGCGGCGKSRSAERF